MALAATLVSVRHSGGDVVCDFNVTASGSYTTGGDTLNLSSYTQDPNFVGPAAVVPSSQPPKRLTAASQTGQIKYQYAPAIGTTQANCLLLVISAFNTQIAASTYPAEVTGDTIGVEAVFSFNI